MTSAGPSEPTRVLAVDPGKHALGWSAWSGGDLVACGLARAEGRDLGALAAALVEQVPCGADVAVVERMVHGYTSMAAIKDKVAKDLLDLQAIGGYVAGASGARKVVWASAHEWKGETPKTVTAKRVDKALRPEELATMRAALKTIPKALRHNLVDGVAIGLWYLRRIPR